MNATTILALGAAAAALGGCNSTPSCDKVVRHVAAVRELGEDEVRTALARCQQEDWPDELRSCAMKAKTDEEMTACTSRSARPRSRDTYTSYGSRARATEAELHLHKLERALRTHYMEYAQFPVGEAGPSPSRSCCQGPDYRCRPDASVWDQPVWRELDFSVDEDSLFQLTYGSPTGRTAIVDATGDLDCDGTTSTYTLTCTSEDGSPRCTVEKPARID